MDTRDDGQGSVYNAALHFRPGQEEIQRYAKRVLFPFAEEIPFQWMRAIAARYGITDSFTRGQAAKIFPSQVPIGTTICYEETFGNLVRENRNLGAEVLVNLSADGWYPHSRLPLQHFTHGRLRAIENGIPLLRSCHTGITAAVDSLGRTLAQVGDKHGGPEELSQALWVEVPRYNYRTIYSACGDGLIVGSSLLLVLLFFRTRVVRAAS